MAAYWIFSVAWLRALSRTAGRDDKVGTSIAVFGVAGAFFLIVYVTFLGTQGPVYDFMRRYGVYLYFLFTVVAQLLLVAKVMSVSSSLCIPRVIAITKIQLAVTLIPFALGILNLVLKAVLEDAVATERMIEWIFALLMHSYFLLSYFSWRETGYDASFSVERSRVTNP